MIGSTRIGVHRTRPAMGTLFEVQLRGDDAEHLAAVADAILGEVQRIERLLSRFDPRSEISRINRLAFHEPVRIDQELADLLWTCSNAAQATRGAFDIAATSLGGMPALSSVSKEVIPAIVLHYAGRLIRFTNAQTQLDLGAIGKGYALDRAATILEANGVDHALLHGGTSSVLARGLDEEGQVWRIALRDPVTGEAAGTVRLKNESLSCSAVNEQGDLIDPATGRPVVGAQGVAVVASSATDAEIWSTALLCAGRERAEQQLWGLGDPWTTVIWLS